MSSGQFENKILDAIQVVVDNAISKANYDRTVQATVIKCANEATGKYVVKFQDSLMYAYNSNLDTTYSKGANVYVLIPSNNTGLNKQIIGSVSNLGTDYVEALDEENLYENVGKNCSNSAERFGLCSYQVGGETIVLYDKEKSINKIGFNTKDAELYFKNSDYLTCGANFQTNLNLEQQYAGNYGIGFDLTFIDNADGSEVKKSYIVDIDQMSGNPYQLVTETRQVRTFKIEGANFKAVEKIYVFEKDFPNIAEGKENDIFISNIELCGANLIPTDELSDCALSIITPKGIYFDDTYLDTETLSLEAQLRVKGKVISENSESVKYYWFRENNAITYTSNKYNRYGGAGWECLNDFTETEGGNEWLPASYRLMVTKAEVAARTTDYKCVAVYNKDTVVTKKVAIQNYSSAYDITIESDSGTQFYYDLGTPTLTCLINGEEKTAADYTYVWSVVDNNNIFESLENSTRYEVSNNKIIKLPINTINGYSTFKCSVYYKGNRIGVGTITLTNSLEGENIYSLIIDNGDQIFKYNEAGISPASGSLKNPIDVLPLSFTLFDDVGNEVPHSSIRGEDIQWIVPTEQTMIKIVDSYGDPVTKDDEKHIAIYQNLDEIGFKINSSYNVRYTNNVIQLIVNYKGKKLIARTDLSFFKEGEIGTNGTDFVCKIIPNVNSSISPKLPLVTYNESTKTASLNYSAAAANKWFKVELWHNGENIFSNTTSGTSSENGDNQVNVSWSMLKNQYNKNIVDNSNFTIDESTGAITFNSTDYAKSTTAPDPANIVKCTVTYQGMTYYATMPILLARVKNNNYTIALQDNTGFTSAMYATDGTQPIYDSANPFEIIVKQLTSGDYDDISQENNISYDWNVLGNIYLSEWQSQENLIVRTSLKEKNKKAYRPIDKINGMCLTNAIYCKVTQNGSEIGSIHIPVHLYLNRYGNAAMNGWDGNTISINDEDGVILAPQVGAGKKEQDNSFTGVFMGSVAEAGSQEVETGLFGYNQGERTIELNSEDGSAKFGKNGGGQIVISPNEGEGSHSYLRSGDYEAPVVDENGNIITPGKGLEIDLTDPSITFGTGKFRVTKDGDVFAEKFATVEDLNKGKITVPSTAVDGLDTKLADLEDSIKYLEIFLPTQNVVVTTDTAKKPLATSSSVIQYTAAFKGKAVAATAKVKNAITNVNVTPSVNSTTKVGQLTFATTKDKALPEVTNTMTLTFSYTIDKVTYSIDKQVAIILNVVGDAGVSVTSIEEQYYSSEESTSLKNGAWTGDYPGWQKDKYIWTRSVITYSNGTSKETTPICVSGENGKGISSSTVEYKISTNGTTVPTGTWSKTLLTPKAGEYLWTRTTVNYEDTNTQPSVSYSVSYRGINGTDGKGIKETKISYFVTETAETVPADTEAWVDTFPTVEEDKYIWTKTITTYTDNKKSTSYSVGRVGSTGDDGISITKVDVEYYLSENALAPIGSTTGWSTTAPQWENGKYMWSRTIVYYSDGSNKISGEPVCITGAKGTDGTSVTILGSYKTLEELKAEHPEGAPGDSYMVGKQLYIWSVNLNDWNDVGQIAGTDGKNGQTSYMHIKYSNDGGKTFTGNAGEDVGDYLGQYVDFTKADSTDVTKYSWKLIKGADGIDGVGISEVEEYYLLNNSKATIPDVKSTDWSKTVPTMTKDKPYLWNYEKVKYTNNTSKNTTPKIIGMYGEVGRGITSITNYYLATSASKDVTKNTTGWTTTVQSTSSSKKYLWNYEAILYTDSATPVTTDPAIIGMYAANGVSYRTFIKYSANADGSDYTDKPVEGTKYIGITSVSTTAAPTNKTSYTWSKYTGNGISNTKIDYAVSNSGSVKPDESEWSETMPVELIPGQFLWTRTTLSYTDTDDQQVFSVGMIGANADSIGVFANNYNVKSTSNSTKEGILYIKGIEKAHTISRGYTVFTIDKDTLEVLSSKGFDTYSSDTTIRDNLATYIKGLENCIVVVIAADAWNTNAKIREAFASIGASDKEPAIGTSSSDRRVSHYIIGMPGLKPGQGYEEMSTAAITCTVPVAKGTGILINGAKGDKGRGIASTEVKYQASSNGSDSTKLDNTKWTTTVPIVTKGQYLWTRTTINYDDDTQPSISYSVAYQGTNGINSYTYIRYSVNEDGSGMVSIPTSETKYIGIYSGTKSTVPAYTEFTWNKYLGDQGIQGPKGDDGITHYTWIKYADDSVGTNMSDDPTGKGFIGIAENKTTATESSKASDYTWSKFVGENGVSAYSVILSNENQTIAGDTTKALATTITTDVIGYQGTAQIETTVGTITGLPDGMTAAISNNGKTNTSITFTVTTAMKTKTGKVIIPVTVGSSVINKVFTYSLALKGATGTNASLITINPSSLVFKSNDGGLTFSPNNIILTPRLQSTTFGKWRYSVDGGSTWTQVTRIESSTTECFYNTSGYALTIPKNATIYTTDITSIQFRCENSSGTIHDTVTVIKLYDVTDLQIGGRNLALKTSDSVTSKNTITTIDLSSYGIGALKKGTQVVISADIRADKDGASYDCYIRSDNNQSMNDISKQLVSQEFKRYSWKTIVTKDLTSKWVAFRTTDLSNSVLDATFTIKNVKVEIGNVATDWTPAPEDSDNKLAEFAETVTNNLTDIQSQIDGQVITWFYSGAPSSSVQPESSWTTNVIKDKHIGDYYYNTSTGDAYQYSTGYKWTKVSSAVAEALAAGQTAQATADNKRRVFTSQPIPPYEIGDLWTDGNDLKVCKTSKTSGNYAAADWTLATNYTDFSIDDIEIGGRNLLLKTATPKTVTGTNKANQTANLYTFVNSNLHYCGLANETVIGSLEYELSEDAVGSVQFQADGPLWSYFSSFAVKADSLRKGKFIWPAKNMGDIAEKTFKNIQIRLDNFVGSITIKNMKIEKGNIATDWTPAPEDMENELSTFAETITNNFQEQIDGKIDTWFYEGKPTSSNKPEKDWTTTDIKKTHVGDFYYDTATGDAYQYNSSYAWEKVSTAVADALSTAKDAQDTADNKRTVFTSEPKTPYYVGDLWTNGTDLKVCKTQRLTGNFETGDWKLATNYTDFKLSDIHAGGRNLLLKEKCQMENWTKLYPERQDIVSKDYTNTITYKALDGGWEISYKELPKLEVGEEYILSFDYVVKADYERYGSYTYGLEVTSSIPESKASKDVIGKYTLPNKATSKTRGVIKFKAAEKNFMMFNGGAINDGQTNISFEFSYFKLEKGNLATDWTPAPEDATNDLNTYVNTITENIEDLQSQLDNQVMTWFYKGTPTKSNDPAKAWTTDAEKTKHIGDFYYDTDTGNAYKYSAKDTWTKVSEAVAKALSTATSAKDIADNKRRVFINTPTTPYEVGDLWTDGANLKVCKTARASGDYTAADWQLATDYTNFKMSDIQLGGTNLLKGSRTLESWEGTTGKGVVTKNSEGFGELKYSETGRTSTSIQSKWGNKVPIEMLKDKYVTFSVEMKVEDYSAWDNQCYFIWEGYTDNSEKGGNRIAWNDIYVTHPKVTMDINALKAGEWVRAVFVSKVDKATGWTSYTTGKTFEELKYLGIRLTLFKNGTITYRKPKLEVGNIPTEWSPAPEDAQLELQSQVEVINSTLEDIQTQLDGAIETWFYKGVPTLTNTPAKDWTTDTEKTRHIGDLYYDTDTNYAYRFMQNGSTFSWEKLSDSDISKALEAASKAQDTADGKRRVFYETPVPPYDKGDLWVQGSNGDILRCQTAKAAGAAYAAGDWIKASKYTDDTKANQVQTNLDNLQIGGRNLILKSDIWVENGRTSTGITRTVEDGILKVVAASGNGNWNFFDRENVIEANMNEGDPFTFSIEIKSKDGTKPPQIYFKNGMGYYNMKGTVSSEYSIVYYTGTWKKTNGIAFHFGWVHAIGTYYIRKIKFEKGNKATAWTPAPEDTTTYVDNLVSDLQTQVDNKIETFSQTTDPSTSWTTTELKTNHTGDIWYNSSTKKTQRWSGTTWVNLENAEAQSAQALASKKAQVFTGTPTIPYYKGDLWITALNGTGIVKTCQTSRTSGSYTASDWVEGLKYTDNTLATTVQNDLKLTQGLTSGDPTNYWQVNNDTAKHFGYTPEADANGTWYNMDTLERNHYPSEWFECIGGEKISVSYDIQNTAKADNVYENPNNDNPIKYVNSGVGLHVTDAKEQNNDKYTWIIDKSVLATEEGPITHIEYITTLPDYARKFRAFHQINAWRKFSGYVKVRNVQIRKLAVQESIVEYYLSTSATSLAGGSWGSTAPTWVNGKYMWTRTKVTYQNGQIEYKPSSAGTCIAGAKGDTGTGIKSTTVKYVGSASGVTTPTSGWQDAIPSVAAGNYLWTKTTLTYDNNTTKDFYTVAKMGDTGATGNGISKVENYYKLADIKTVEGTNVKVSDTLELGVSKITPKGRFEQATTKGKNLACIRADKIKAQPTDVKIVGYDGENGVSLTTTSDSIWRQVDFWLEGLEPSTKYILHYEIPKYANITRTGIGIDGYTSKTAPIRSWNSDHPVSVTDAGLTTTFTTPSSDYVYDLRIWLNMGASDFTAETEKSVTISKIYIAKEDSYSGYEPYTNGVSPNPDYPQDVKVVTGDVNVKLETENLIYNTQYTNVITNGVTMTYNKDTDVYTFDGTCTKTTDRLILPEMFSLLKDIPTGEKYTLSIKRIGGTNSNEIKITNRVVKNEEFDWSWGAILYPNEKEGKETYTFDVENTYVNDFRFYITKDSVFNNLQLKIELVKGDKTGSFIKHQEQIYPLSLGNIELYSNDIFINKNNRWYLHKEHSKYICNGKESIVYNDIEAHNRFTIKLNNAKPFGSDIIDTEIYCNLLSQASNSITWNKKNDFVIHRRMTGSDEIMIRLNDSITSVDQAKQWLENNKPTIYYPLATPIEEEITNAKLSAQLDALQQATTYKDITNISTSGDLSPIIKTDYFKQPSAQDTDWSTDALLPTKEQPYLWNYEKITYTNGTSVSTTPVLIGSYGKDGNRGRGVDKITTLYYVKNSATAAPTKPTSEVTSTSTAYNVWTTACPTWQTDYYIWICTQIKYSDLSIEWTDPYTDTTWTAVNEIEIGGRNLFTKTGVPATWSNIDTSTTTNDFTTKNFYLTPGKQTLADLGLKVNDYVTMSFDWTLTNVTKAGTLRAELGTGTLGYTVGMNKVQTIGSATSGRYVATRKLDATGLTSNAFRLRVDSSTFTIKISNVKFEKGNKATAWTAAPEDTIIGGTNLAKLGSIKKYGSSSITTVDNTNFRKDGSAVITRTAYVNEGPIIDAGIKIEKDQQYVTQFYLKFTDNTINSFHIYNGHGHTNTKVYVDDTYKGFFAQDIDFPTDLAEHKITLYYTGTTNRDLPISDTSTTHTIFQPMKSTAKAYTANIRNFKTELGNTPTAWSLSPEDIQDQFDYSTSEVVVGTQTAATNAWTGVSSLSTLTDGQQISYWLPYDGTGSSATLNLTLSTGTTTGAIAIYYKGTTRVTTHFNAGSVVHLTYRVNASVKGTNYTGWWADASYDSGNTYDRIKFNQNIKASAAIKQYNLIGGTAAGYKPIAASTAYDLDKPILWAGNAISANGTGSNNYISYHDINITQTVSGLSLTQYETAYLVGTVNGNTFTTIASNFITTTKPTSENGYYYMSLGYMASTTKMILYPEHPLYKYVNGSFKNLNQVAYEAQDNLDNLQIGGRNLILNYRKPVGGINDYQGAGSSFTINQDSTTKSGYNIKVDVKAYSADTTKTNYNIYLSSIPRNASAKEQNGKTYTFSFLIKCSESVNGWRGYFEYINKGIGPINLTTEWQRISITGQATSVYTAFYVVHGKEIRDKLNGKTLYFSDLKLEEGNKATDWTPAPEDDTGKRCKIVSPTDTFTSTTGSNGIYLPGTILLTPEFNETTFSKWYYNDGSVNSNTGALTWVAITPSGTAHSDESTVEKIKDCGNGLGLTETSHSLLVPSTFKSTSESLTFKCEATDTSVYDTITIKHTYDMSDLIVGARNYILETKKERTELCNTTMIYQVSEDFSSMDNRDRCYLSFEAMKQNGSGLTDAIGLIVKGRGIKSDGTAADPVTLTTISALGNSSNRYSFKVPAVSGIEGLYQIIFEATGNTTNASKNRFTIGKPQLEISDIVTDWTPAPEDVENISFTTQTQIAFSKKRTYQEFIKENIKWYDDYDGIVSGNLDGYYQWTRNKITYSDGRDPEYSIPVCSAVVTKEFIGSEEFYLPARENQYNATTAAKASGWTTTKPSWGSYVTKTDGPYELWVKTRFTYQYGTSGTKTTTDSTPFVDTEWKSSYYLNEALEKVKNKVESLEGSFVETTSEYIQITGATYQNNQKKKTNDVMRIDSAGIRFSNDGGKTWSNAWNIDGTFVTNKIDTSALMAQIAQQGHLKLGGDTLGEGQLSIYGAQDVTSKSAKIYIDSSGLHITTSKNGTIDIDQDDGIKYVNSANKTILKTNEDNQLVTMNKVKAEDSIQVGTTVKIIQINSSSQKGIAFIASTD